MGSEEPTIDKRTLDKDKDKFKNLIKNRTIQSRVEHCPTATDGQAPHTRNAEKAFGIMMVPDKAENRKSKSKGSRASRSPEQPSRMKMEKSVNEETSSVQPRTTTPIKKRTPTKKSAENVRTEAISPKPDVEDKHKNFISRISTIEKSQTLKDYFIRNLMNVGPPQPKFDSFYKPHNRMKNRSTDAMCLETTRVKLKSNDPNADYIHANKIVFEGSKRKYIATQHPLSDTVNDFWSMIYSEGVETIVSLTCNNSIGDFPTFYNDNKEVFTSYGEVQVLCKRVTKPKTKYGSTKYTLEVILNGYSQSNIVELYVYSYWPKNGVPQNPKVVLSLVKAIKTKRANEPIVFQCENGVNQSAVLIYVDALINLLMDPVAKCDFDTIFRELRQQRYSAVSQSVHFTYSIHVVVEYLKLLHTTLKTCPDIIKMIDENANKLTGDFANCKFTEPGCEESRSPTGADLI